MSNSQGKSDNWGEDFAKSVKSVRSDCHLSQQKLADELGISRNYVSMLEQGRKEPSEQLRRAFTALAYNLRKRSESACVVEGIGPTMRTGIVQEIPPDMFPRSRRPESTAAAASAGATGMAVGKFSVAELEEVMTRSLQRLREEKHPLLKLAHLLTLRTCAEDLERRLSGEK